MRFFATIALLAGAALTMAQSTQNAINIPLGGQLQVTAGQPTTITWSNPSPGTVSIYLQQGGAIQPGDGILLEANIPASAGTATFTIDPSLVNLASYSFQIVSESDPTVYNFSTQFTITGATGQSISSNSMSMSMTSMASSASSASASSASDASASSASDSSASSGSASSASRSSGSASSAASASRTSSASASAQSTSAPTGAAMPLKAQSGLVLAVFGAAVLL